MIARCQYPVVVLPLLHPGPSSKKWNRSSIFCNCDHYRGGHRAISWCDPATSDEHPATGHAGEEGCYEEVDAVSLHLVA
jgi:hypothetical protein